MSAPLPSPGVGSATGSGAGLEGYAGHLTPAQERALQDIKDILSKEGVVFASIEDEAHGDRTHGVSDLELLRFCRARRFDIQRTSAMYRATLAWRSKIKLDTLYADFPWTKARLAFRQFYPTYFHKEDLSGSPIHIHELGKLDIDKLIKTIGSEQAVQYLYLLNESNFRERFPACTEQLRQRAKAIASAESRSENGSVASTSSLSKATAGSPAKPKTEAEDAIGREAMELGEVETVTAILDIKGAGIMTFWKVKDLLGQVIQISDLHYPETANRLFIINAPYMFSTIWSYVKALIDARTASRVFILGADYRETLLKYIAPENLPAYLGGKCECKGVENGCRNGSVGCWNDYKGVSSLPA